MNSFADVTVFDVKGTRIPYADIRDYGIVKKEYIYRPVYKEKQASLAKMMSVKKYEFLVMTPYAAIISQAEYDKLTKKKDNKWKLEPEVSPIAKEVEAIVPIAAAAVKAIATGGNVLLDIATNAVVPVVGGSLEQASLRSKEKYFCINQAGRVFTTTLAAIPPVLVFFNGQIADADGIKSKITVPSSQAPTIKQVDCLAIITKSEQYTFYGDSIDIPNAQVEYDRLKSEMDTYGLTTLDEQKTTKKPLLSDKIKKMFS